jgi:DNA-directed RNA polymerase specialized sigma24 family protein
MGFAIKYRPRRGKPRKTNDPLADTKAAVRAWANWFHDRAENGYPPHSWEGRAILRGGSAPRPQDSVHSLPVHELADRVEREIGLMDGRLRDALMARHIKRLGDKSASRYCKCSLSGFKERCMRAYWWLKGRLDS